MCRDPVVLNISRFEKLNKKKIVKTNSLTLIWVRRGEDGAVLSLHLLDFLCQRLDKTPDFFHLASERERGRERDREAALDLATLLR